MNLPALDQVLDIHQDEAQALHDSLEMYHYLLTWRSGERPLYLAETMSIRPTLRTYERLVRLLASPWPRNRWKLLKTRRWRLPFDELLQLNALILQGELFAAQICYRFAFDTMYAKINQKALNLNSHFQL